MKKIVASLVLCMAVIAANAQKAVEGNKFTDNWSVGFNAGGTTPLTHSAFFKNMRAVLGVGLDKQVTPVLGLGFEAMTSINTTPSRTAFDNTNLSVLGTLNLSNLFGGYAGAPRLFEVETVAGIGWLHYAVNGESDLNSMSSKLGLNFNFNLGEEKAWTLAFKPALVYDMSADGTDNVCFNANRAAWEFTAGLKYHFSCSNGKHYFTIVKPYNQSEIDALNDILPTETAVVDVKFKEQLKGVTEGYKDSLSTIQLTSYEPNRLVYKASTPKDGVVVFSEIYYPGWQATIDGQPVDIARADYILRAINMPAGEHTIEMWFDPQSIHVTESIAYAALALLLIGVMLLAWTQRSKIAKKS
mgnify:CR=1 FL=1